MSNVYSRILLKIICRINYVKLLTLVIIICRTSFEIRMNIRKFKKLQLFFANGEMVLLTRTKDFFGIFLEETKHG